MEDKFGLLCISEGKTVCVPLLGVRCDVTVEDFIAQIELTQCFHNAEDKTVEALYRFPVDQASSVCGFSATFDDGSVVTARVKEKEEAKKEYDEAIKAEKQAQLLTEEEAKKEYDEATKAGKQAQLLTEERPDVFSITVGNLPPKSSVKITVTLVTTLKAEGVASKLLIPTSIAPRYNPLGSSAVPPVPVSATVFYSLDVTVKYSTRSPIKDISSPTHAATLKESHAGKAGEAAFRGVTMDRDLVVLCEEIDAHAPRACLEVWSGSMQESFDGGYGGEGKTQIDYASEALLLFLRALPETCSFNIISFGSHFESLFPTSQPYSDSTLEQATKLAQAMRADFGGTEILQPLQHALAEKSSWFGEGGSAREKQVFILTDGQVSNEAAVFDLVRKRAGTASSKTRVFSVGVGRSVSHHLVEGIARAGKGTACFVTGGADLRTKVLGQLKQALQPGLDAVTVAWNFPSTPKPTTPTPATATAPLPAATSEKPKPTSTIRTLLGYVSPSLNAAASPKEGGGVPPLHGKVRTFPSVAPPVFSGERFLSLALFEASCKEFSESVTITAVSPDGPLVVTLPLTDEEVFKGTIAHRLAAREAIREFEDWNGGTQRGRGRRWSGGAAGASDSSEVISEAEALALALHHSLASARTSFLAVRETPPLREGPASEPAALRVVPQFGAPEPEAHKYMMRGAAPQMMPQMQMAMPCRGAAMGGAASGGGGGFGGMVGAGAPGG
ncbi:von Willebrand factor type A domain-containing protein, partial [Baffinella frigidus]